MAHVAEASESNGRVLFLLDAVGEDAGPAALAATRLASSFSAEIEAVSVNLDAVGRARQLSVTGVTPINDSGDAAGMLQRAEVHHKLLTARQLQALSDAARRFGVRHFHTSVAGETVDKLDELCLSRGPWNVIVLSSPASAHTASTATAIFANVSGATGIVAVPVRYPYPDGPIAVVVEDEDRLPAMLRAAGRLKGLCARVHLLLAADTRGRLQELETHVRLVTSNHKGLVIEPPQPLLGVRGALDEPLRALKTSFIVARHGGTLLADANSMARTIALASAPFLLVR